MPPESLDLKDFKAYLGDFKIEPAQIAGQEALFDDLTAISIVKSNIWRYRAVFLFETGHGSYYVKLAETLRFKDSFRYKIVPWHKWKEWYNLLKLTQKRLNVALPCLRGVRKRKGPLAYFIVTKAITGRSLDPANLNDAAEMGVFVADLHKNKVYMADLQQGNILVESDGKIGFFDVQRLAFLPFMTKGLRLRNIAFFFHNFESSGYTAEWRQAFLQAYNQIANARFEEADLELAVAKVRKRYAQRHDKRRFKKTAQFMKLKVGDVKGFVRRNCAMDWVAVLDALTPDTNIKEDRVFAVKDLVVKRFPLRFLHADRCFTAFKMAYELEAQGIATPRRIAYLKRGRYSYYLSMLLETCVTVNAYFSNMEPKRKRVQIRAFAAWVSMVHTHDIYQRDFKSCNILCQNDVFYMVDLEGIRLRTPSFDDKVYNLAQLNASVSKYVTLKDRLRFFAAYAKEQNIPKSRHKEILQKIWNVMLEKNTAYYDLAPDDIRPVKRNLEKL